eukprot:604601-Rhodomonas_salina.4
MSSTGLGCTADVLGDVRYWSRGGRSMVQVAVSCLKEVGAAISLRLPRRCAVLRQHMVLWLSA